MDDRSSQQLGEELNLLFSKWQENFQPLEPPLSSFQEIADSIAELANSDANSALFSAQHHTTKTNTSSSNNSHSEEYVTHSLWSPVDEQGNKSLIGWAHSDISNSSQIELLQTQQSELVFSNCTKDDSSKDTMNISTSMDEEDVLPCSSTLDEHSPSVNSAFHLANNNFGTNDSHYFSLLLYINRRKLQAVEDCLEKIYSLRRQDSAQRENDNSCFSTLSNKNTLPWYWNWIKIDSQSNEPCNSSGSGCTALYKYANYFIQRLGYSSSNLYKRYVPFFGIEKVSKGRREVFEPKRHSDAERVGAQKRRQLRITFEKSFRPRDFQQILEKLVMKSAQEETYQHLVDQLTTGVIGHQEFRNKINELSDWTLLDASYQSVKWSREKWKELLDKNTNKLSKSVVVDDVRLYWINYGAAFYRKDPFTKEEDEAILQAVRDHAERNWDKIAKQVNSGRSPWQYFCRYQRTLRPSIVNCKWTIEEDMKLLAAIEKYGTKQWSLVSCSVPGRTRQQCLHRWRRGLRPDIRHGKWTVEEDEKLQEAVEIYGEGHWSQIAEMVPGRTDLQCRERYTDILKPSVSHQPWTEEENEHLLQLVQEMGTGKWSLIASLMKDRSDNQCYRQYKKLQSDPGKVRKRKGSNRNHQS